MPGVIIVPEKDAREKPCLRCRYSLRHIAGARNCPECGLAVRISLSGNDGLEWSNPSWQLFLAVGAMCYAIAILLTPMLWGWDHFFWRFVLPESDSLIKSLEWYRRVYRWISLANQLFMCIALILLARREGRFPDRLKYFRIALLFTAGIYFILQVLDYLLFQIPGLSRSLPRWFWNYVYRPLESPVPQVMRDLLVLCFLAMLARRARERRFERYIPIIVIIAAFRIFLGITNLVTHNFRIILDLPWLGLYPVGVAALCIWMNVILHRNIRDASGNWVSD